MDVVWVAKSKNSYLLNSRGQSIVEYILLLAVLSALAFTVFNNARFKEFMAGKGFLEGIRKGMEYSYRYGREMKAGDYERGANFGYNSYAHDSYFNSEKNETRFFTGVTKYGADNN